MNTKTTKTVHVEELQIGDIIRIDERTTLKVEKEVVFTFWAPTEKIFVTVPGYRYRVAGICEPFDMQRDAGSTVEVEV